MIRIAIYILYVPVCVLLLGLTAWIVDITGRCETPIIGVLVDFSKYVPAMVGSVAMVFGPLFAHEYESRRR